MDNATTSLLSVASNKVVDEDMEREIRGADKNVSEEPDVEDANVVRQTTNAKASEHLPPPPDIYILYNNV